MLKINIPTSELILTFQCCLIISFLNDSMKNTIKTVSKLSLTCIKIKYNSRTYII